MAIRSTRGPQWLPWLGAALTIVIAGILIYLVATLLDGPGPRTDVEAPRGDGVLRLQGSNTIGADLAPDLAEAFLVTRGATDVERVSAAGLTTVSGTPAGASDPVRIEIRADGTEAGLAGLRDGSVDVAMASRRLTAAEAGGLAVRGDLLSRASEQVLALDGVVILRPETGVVALSLDDLRRVFTCEITDWSQLRGTPGPIRVLARDERSGTFEFFRDRVLAGKPLCATERFADSGELASAVAQDPRAIGFVGLPFVGGNRVAEIYDGQSTPTGQDSLSVSTESYLLTRRLFLYLPTLPVDDPLARDFAETFGLSERGQRVVEAAGFVSPLFPPPPPPAPPCVEAPAEYCAAVAGATRVPFDVRFATGIGEVDNRGFRNLDLFAQEVDGAAGAGRVLLIGFADNAGTDEANRELSGQRAEAVQAYLAGKGITAVVNTLGLGEQLPVASNTTAEGREQNRRVEVWLR